MIIKNNDSRMIVIGEVKLLPGCNDVDPIIWSQCKKEYDLNLLTEENQIEEIFEKVVKDGAEVDKPFNSLTIKKKKDIINDTFNIKSLQKWDENEQDMAIRKLIEDRIKDIAENKVKEKYGIPRSHV